MQGARERFKVKGLEIASISYDSDAVLRAFAKRSGVTFPMLADPGSRLIRQFRMVDPDNTENNVPSYGNKDVAYPGYFVVNPAGMIVERFVDERYDDRRTGNSVVAMMFPELLETSGGSIAAPHIQFKLGQTDSRVTLGTHVRLLVDLDLPKNMHVYAPGVEGYRPVELLLDTSTWYKNEAPRFPPPRTLHLKAIREIVPVYVKDARITIDVVFANTFALMKVLGQAPNAQQRIDVTGRLRYQACDDKVCFMPAEVPVKWTFDVRLPDQQRITGAPSAIN